MLVRVLKEVGDQSVERQPAEAVVRHREEAALDRERGRLRHLRCAVRLGLGQAAFLLGLLLGGGRVKPLQILFTMLFLLVDMDLILNLLRLRMKQLMVLH